MSRNMMDWTRGIPCAKATALAALTPINKAPTSPGPSVTAMASKSSYDIPAVSNSLLQHNRYLLNMMP